MQVSRVKPEEWHLHRFRDTSENRRVDRKAAELDIRLRVVPRAEFNADDVAFRAFCRDRPLLRRVLESLPGTVLRVGVTFGCFCFRSFGCFGCLGSFGERAALGAFSRFVPPHSSR